MNGILPGVVALARGRFSSKIKLNREQINLGYFSTQEEAHAAYMQAKAALHPYFHKERS